MGHGPAGRWCTRPKTSKSPYIESFPGCSPGPSSLAPRRRFHICSASTVHHAAPALLSGRGASGASRKFYSATVSLRNLSSGSSNTR
eukprot:scaffold25251_cov65-Phaeocystis_antarctica.AAC.1